MGNFYTNITVRAPLEEACSLLSSLRREAFVGAADGFSIVCDRETDRTHDLDALASLAMTISRRLTGPALAVLNHDDDVLLFGLYEDGALACEWGGSTATSKRVFVERVQRAMGTSPVARSRSTGRRWWVRLLGSYLFMIDKHEEIAAEIGLPAASVGAGFKYVERDDLPGAKKSDFVRV